MDDVINETNIPTPEKSISERIEEERKKIEETINGTDDGDVVGLRQEVEELEAKLADDSNYFVTVTEDEKLEMELIEEEIEEIHRLEKSLPEAIEACDKGINLLNKEIADISTRLRKNKIAVEKNYFSQLSEEEVTTLQEALDGKTERLTALVERKQRIQERFDGLDKRLKALLKSKDKLSEILAGDKFDKYKKLLDQNRWHYLKSGLESLENRKKYINAGGAYSEYINKDLNDEITAKDAEIAALKARLEELENNKEKEEPKKKDEINEEENVDSYGIGAPVVGETSEDKSQALIDSYLNGNEDITNEKPKDERIFTDEFRIPYGKNKGLLAIPEETTAHDIWLAGNPDLDIEREAEIEEAKEILKEKKKTSWFKEKWVKWTAAALAVCASVVMLLQLKGCDANTNNIKPQSTTNNNIFNSQTDEGIQENKEKEYSDKFITPEDNEKDDEKNLEAEVNNNTNENENDNSIDSITGGGPDPEPEPEINPDLEPEPDQSTNTGEAELNAGEKFISAEELLNGETIEEPGISHGDEVGTTVPGAELKDYTEDGKAIVEYEKGNVQNEVSDTKGNTQSEVSSLKDKLLEAYGAYEDAELFDPSEFDAEGHWIGHSRGSR